MPNPNIAQSFVSVVVKSSDFSPDLWREKLGSLIALLESNFEDFEVVIVENDKSSYASELIQVGLVSYPCLRYIRPTAELDENDILELGVVSSIGDYIVLYDCNRDPLTVILEAVTLCNTDRFEIIYGKSKSFSEPSFKQRLCRAFERAIGRIIGYRVLKGATAFRCLTRKAVLSVSLSSNRYSQIYLNIHKCGLPIGYLSYESLPLLKQHSLFSCFNRCMNVLILNSTKPLRFVSLLGVAGSSISLGFAFYSFVTHFVKTNVASGWTSTILIMTFLFTLLFIILVVLGEYIGRILKSNGQRKKHFSADEHCSLVMINQRRINISTSSE